ncbi:hypothetical protein AYK21_03945 [Thermoplasmatales archaeon SG8-52-2]|nr:MAG: hypothetical protein AYK21_03945 [Thermoplasmatales archaeon SG8-52-2]
MKNLLSLAVISILFIGMPMTTAISQISIYNSKSAENILFNNITADKMDTPPNWANGNFTGVWGLDIWGQHEIPLGWMFGYYKLSIDIGYFAAGFNIFGDPDISWFIQGYIFGIFMFGHMGENEYTNETYFVGIGKCNKTDYHWRIIGEEGPVFYMEGEYTIFV